MNNPSAYIVYKKAGIQLFRLKKIFYFYYCKKNFINILKKLNHKGG